MKKNDVILIVLILLASGFIYAGMRFWQKQNTYENAYVEVTVGEELYGRYPLSQDYTEKIDFGDGEYNVLVIKDGQAFVSEASCPDKICVKHSHIHYSAESIACLPHGLIIKIVGGEENQVDAVTN